MWDKETPLQLLNTMPKVLEEEDLKRLQLLLEADRYKNQIVSGVDLCGIYAPFCYKCKKDNNNSCAVAYINYLNEQGTDIQIATAVPNKAAENITTETETTAEDDAGQAPEIDNAEPSPSPEVDNEVEQAPVIEEIEAVADETEPEGAVSDEVVLEEEPPKTKIRIAIARKKTLL